MALDPRPLSERFDLTYVRRRYWPKRWTHWLTYGLVIAAGLPIAVVTALDLARPGRTPLSYRLYTPGPLSHSHAGFGNDCRQCHQPDPQRSGFWLPVSDQACVKCHDAPAHHPIAAVHPAMTVPMMVALGRGRLADAEMSTRCADCHGEHN